MPVIPFAGTVGAWMGAGAATSAAAAAAGGTAIVAGLGAAAAVGTSMSSSHQQTKAMKGAAANEAARAAQAKLDLEQSAANATKMSRARALKKAQDIAGGSNIFTSPLGLPDIASGTRKTLLGG